MTKKFPLVSIVTPTYNQAKYLTETIEKVLAQDYPNIEYIILDDGSTDETPEILKKYSGKIRYERHANMGQARTLNKGWAMSSGTLLGYLSSDDILYPGAIRKLVEILESDESIVCSFPDADLIDSQSRIIKKNICRPFNLGDLIIRQECYIGPGALFRRSAFDVVGGWKTKLKLAPDREFWMRLSAHGRFELCSDVLAGYRMHSDSISYKDVSELAASEYLWVLDQYFESALVPVDIASRKSEAYGCAKLILARNCFRSGYFKRGWMLYQEACHLHPPLRNLNIIIKIIRNVISKPARIALSAFRSSIKN
jgi:glycosyltransferase involved in cell wall biosynthesis